MPSTSCSRSSCVHRPPAAAGPCHAHLSRLAAICRLLQCSLQRTAPRLILLISASSAHALARHAPLALGPQPLLLDAHCTRNGRAPSGARRRCGGEAVRQGWCGELKPACVGLAAGCVVQARIHHGLGGSSKKIVTAGDTQVMTHTRTRARTQTLTTHAPLADAQVSSSGPGC